MLHLLSVLDKAQVRAPDEKAGKGEVTLLHKLEVRVNGFWGVWKRDGRGNPRKRKKKYDGNGGRGASWDPICVVWL